MNIKKEIEQIQNKYIQIKELEHEIAEDKDKIEEYIFDIFEENKLPIDVLGIVYDEKKISIDLATEDFSLKSLNKIKELIPCKDIIVGKWDHLEIII